MTSIELEPRVVHYRWARCADKYARHVMFDMTEDVRRVTCGECKAWIRRHSR